MEVRNMVTALEEYEAKGRVEERYEIAENLLEMGMSADDVSKGTGLSVEEVEQLKI